MLIAIWIGEDGVLGVNTYKSMPDLRKALFAGECPNLPDNVIILNKTGLVNREVKLLLEEVDIN
tara:strand:- start:19 stop:210 length:192 start_codon:yes stop_codon:yes gene_type:complete